MLNAFFTILASPTGQQLIEAGGQELVQVFALLIKKHGAVALTTPIVAAGTEPVPATPAPTAKVVD